VERSPTEAHVLAIEARDCPIFVAPPPRPDGVASMLVALGAAGIAVRKMEPRTDDSGIYLLTVNDNPALARRILARIGCRINVDV
jgi:hypothetical protein